MSKSNLAKEVKEEMKINNADPSSFEDTLELVKNNRLHGAIYAKNIVAIKVMLKNGCEIYRIDLVLCIERKYTNLFKFLFEHIRDHDSLSQRDIDNTLVPCIIEHSRTKIMLYLIENNLLHQNPLIEAVKQNNKKMFFFLLEKKFPLRKTEIFLYDTIPSLYYTEKFNNLEIFNFLLSRGFNVNVKNDQALYAAVYRENTEAVQLLLKNGARLTRKNLLDNAVEYSTLEILKLLLQAGLKIETLSMQGLNSCINKSNTNKIFEFLLTNYKDKITFTPGNLKQLKRYPEKRAIYERIMGI